jgi:DNA-binding transcriptional LysR family regulator
MMESIELAELWAFLGTVESGSLSKAAKSLGVPRATVGLRLSRLEAKLQARLLRRTTRSLALTEAGQALVAHARRILADVGEAEAAVRHLDDAPKGRVRVSTPAIESDSFRGAICRFLRDHPDVELTLLTSSSAVRFDDGRFDVALRGTVRLDPGLTRRLLFRSEMVAVASAEHLARHGEPKRMADLAGHPCILGSGPGDAPESEWPTRRGGVVRVSGRLVTDDLGLKQQAVVAGLGIALLPRFVAAPLVANEHVRVVLEGRLGAPVDIALVYPERPYLPRVVQAFIEAIAAWANDEYRRTK